MSDLPTVSIITILHDWNEFYKLIDYHWNNLDYPKNKLEWIIIDDSKENHIDYIPNEENIPSNDLDDEIPF